MKKTEKYDLFTVILAIIGAAAAIAGIAYAIYRFISPDYLEEYMDDFDDSFDDAEDYFDNVDETAAE